ncbi:MAG: prenyltransferase [Methanomassiliicoccales archaeon]|nr:prenyltransferase [Methanomassiliicoccales archaeon]
MRKVIFSGRISGSEGDGVEGQSYSLGYRIKNVLRVAYTLPFVIASVVGVAFALTQKSDWLLAFLIPLDVFFLALFVNISNDYFDHRSGTDKVRFSMIDKAFDAGQAGKISQKIYWQGNSFDRGLISDRGGKMLITGIAIAAGLIAIPIILSGGILVIIMGAIAFGLSYFYSAPPLILGSRGLGEFDVGLSFALIAFFSYYVMATQFSWTMVLIATAVGISVAMMRVVDEMSGMEAHKIAGEKDLVVRLGIDGATRLLIVAYAIMYVLAAVLTFINLTFILLFLTVPLAYRAIKPLRKKVGEFWIVEPVVQVFGLALAQMLLVIVALILQTVLTSV